MLTKKEVYAIADNVYIDTEEEDRNVNALCQQAIAAIGLAAENERLKAENKVLKENCDRLADTIVGMNAAEIENARLKAKLDKIKDKAWATGLHSDHDIYTNAITEIYQMCKDGDDT